MKSLRIPSPANIETAQAEVGMIPALIQNAKLGWGVFISNRGRGFEMINSFGYSGSRPTLAEAQAEYERMEVGNAEYERQHDC